TGGAEAVDDGRWRGEHRSTGGSATSRTDSPVCTRNLHRRRRHHRRPAAATLCTHFFWTRRQQEGPHEGRRKRCEVRATKGAGRRTHHIGRIALRVRIRGEDVGGLLREPGGEGGEVVSRCGRRGEDIAGVA